MECLACSARRRGRPRVAGRLRPGLLQLAEEKARSAIKPIMQETPCLQGFFYSPWSLLPFKHEGAWPHNSSYNSTCHSVYGVNGSMCSFEKEGRHLGVWGFGGREVGGLGVSRG